MTRQQACERAALHAITQQKRQYAIGYGNSYWDVMPALPPWRYEQSIAFDPELLPRTIPQSVPRAQSVLAHKGHTR